MYNKENLLRMADYIETVPQEKFTMSVYRGEKDFKDASCDTIGCAVGHCTILAPHLIKQTELGIDFEAWVKEFTGVEWASKEWRWLFSGIWVLIDNTPTGAAKRIRHFVEHGLPDDWEQIMNGEKPLPYE